MMIDIAMQGVRVERKEYKIKIYKDWRRVRVQCSVVPVALELFPSGLPHTRFWTTLANTKSGDLGNGPAIEKRFWSQSKRRFVSRLGIYSRNCHRNFIYLASYHIINHRIYLFQKMEKS